MQRYSTDLAVVHRNLLDSSDEVLEGLDKINKADAGDHPGDVVAPVLRRRVAATLRADLHGSDMSVYTVQFGGLRLRFNSGGRAQVVAKVRKRKREWQVLSDDCAPLEIFPEFFRPGTLTLLWDLFAGQIRSVTLARTDDSSWDGTLGIYEETPLPPPAAKAYSPPPGSFNDDDDLRELVRSRDNDSDDLGDVVTIRRDQ